MKSVKNMESVVKLIHIFTGSDLYLLFFIYKDSSLM